MFCLLPPSPPFPTLSPLSSSSGSRSPSSSSTTSMIGTIMALVAVLDIHMERTVVAAMKPSMRRPGEEPMPRMAPRAIRRWRLHSSMLVARTSAKRQKNLVQ